jgi:ABC-type oligopeptide transport system substrate-binding subunit/class 3 adenylate cyclase
MVVQMKCLNCEHINPPEARYCQRCGHQMQRACSRCATPNEPDAVYCKHCGAPLGEPPQTPVQYTPTTLQEKAGLLTSRQADGRQEGGRQEGERKHVTILFTDIVGSTALAEKLDPEEWREVVSGAHNVVGEVVNRYEGTIAQLLGDGVLAFFGAPQAHEDDPQRAVQAALNIQAGMRDYARKLEGYLDGFQMRIGIHSGLVVVGQVGDDQHMEYLAIGDAVNLAARLQSAASPGGVLISETTARMVEYAFELQERGLETFKGKAEPVRVFTVLASKPGLWSGRAQSQFSSPLVGRSSELEQLNQALEKLKIGLGQIVTVFGEAGIGKSRLALEAKEGAASSGGPEIRWLEGRALSYGSALSFWTITQMIKADIGLSDGDPEARIKVALRRRAVELFQERAEEHLPYLAHLLGIHTESAWSETLRQFDGETVKRQVLISIDEYFACLSKRQPVVLVFEDMHWADPSSVKSLESLLPLTDRNPIMLLILSRPEREASSWRIKASLQSDYAHRFTEISLQPLPNEASYQIIESLLECADLPDEIMAKVLERADGNPLYLEETARSMIEHGAVVREDGVWKVTASIDELTIPDTLQGLLLARIDRLEDDVRQTLQMASVIGRSFLYRLLQRICQAEAQIDENLTRLQRLDLVREKTRQPELEYIFKHTLTQEAAYQSLLLERRRDFHRRVAEALEIMFANQMEDFFGLLAHHFDAAGMPEKAAAYLLQAGDKARVENAFEEAGKHYNRAVELLQGMEDFERQAETWLKIGLIHLAEFDFEAGHKAYETAFRLKLEHTKSHSTSTPMIQPHPPRIFHHAIQLNDKLEGLDPGHIRGSDQFEISQTLFAGLVEYDQATSILPRLARSWQVLDGGRRYLFHLREDAFWSDGKPITAYDFEWAWKRNLAPGRWEYPASLLDDVLGARAFRLGQNPDPGSVGVRALDSWTLEVQLESPLAYFIYMVALPVTFALPRHIVEKFGQDWWLPPHGVYSGPFRLAEYSRTRIRVERSPTFFGTSSGNLDGVEWEILPIEDPEIVRRYLAGEFDLCDDMLLTQVPEGIPSLAHRESLTTYDLLLNPLLPPLDDLRVRQALAHSLDIKTLIRDAFSVFAEREFPNGGIIPSALAGHSPELGLRYDPDLGCRLLAEAGYPAGVGFPELEFQIYPMEEARNAALRRAWQMLGVNCRVTHPNMFMQMDFTCGNLGFFAWVADYPDPDSFLRQLSTITTLRRAGWHHPRFEALVEEAAHMNDRTRRMTLYREADRILVNEEVIVIPLGYSGQRVKLVQPWVKGIEFNIMDHLNYNDVRLER